MQAPLCAPAPSVAAAVVLHMPLLLQALQKTTPLMRQQQAYRYTPLRTNFFTLLRFDFMLDENLDTYLIEVRAPSCTPVSCCDVTCSGGGGGGGVYLENHVC